jgi:hypothetical protein
MFICAVASVRQRQYIPFQPGAHCLCGRWVLKTIPDPWSEGWVVQFRVLCQERANWSVNWHCTFARPDSDTDVRSLSDRERCTSFQSDDRLGTLYDFQQLCFNRRLYTAPGTSALWFKQQLFCILSSLCRWNKLCSNSLGCVNLDPRVLHLHDVLLDWCWSRLGTKTRNSRVKRVTRNSTRLNSNSV